MILLQSILKHNIRITTFHYFKSFKKIYFSYSTFYFHRILSRYSDYAIISENHIEDRGDFLKISLDRTKQDQMYSGTNSFIAETG